MLFSADVCIDMKLTTKNWGSEFAWTFGSCSSKGTTYGDNQEYDIECCQPAGTYEFDCKDGYGDGWHGGKMEIDVEAVAPSVVCHNFQDGHSQKQDVFHVTIFSDHSVPKVYHSDMI